MPTIDLLNSEGRILKLQKNNNNEFVFYDYDDCTIEVYNLEQILGFINGSIRISDCNAREYHYPSEPMDIKPTIGILMAFIYNE